MKFEYEKSMWVEYIIIIVRTLKSYNPSLLKTMSLYSLTLAQINKFIKEEIKQQERASPDDENKEERLDMIKYVGKMP